MMNQDQRLKDIEYNNSKMGMMAKNNPDAVAIPGGQGAELPPNSVARIKRIVRDETEHIFEFIQEYVNEIAMNCIYTVKSDSKANTEKMDSVDWFARNIEFVSMKLFDKFLKVCIDLKDDPKNPEAKMILYSSPHSSGVLTSLRRLVIET